MLSNTISCLFRARKMEADPRIRTIKQALRTYVFAPEGLSAERNVFPPVLLDRMLSDKSIVDHFLKTFTHVSASSPMEGMVQVIEGSNYEDQEMSGDALANFFMLQRIRRALPGLSIKEMNNMLSHYKSNEVYKWIIETSIPVIGGQDLILTGKDYVRTPKMYADVFEALIMAVFEAGEAIQEGFGYSCAENAFAVLTRELKINDSFRHGHPKTYVAEILGKDSFREHGEAKGNQFSVSVTINDAGINKAKDMDPNAEYLLKLPYTATAGNEEIAKRQVYGKIVKDLQLRGLTESAKFYEVINGLGEGLSNTVKAIMKVHGESLEITKTDTGDGRFEWKLFVRRTLTGQRFYVGSTTSSTSPQDFHVAKEALLQKYRDIR